MGENSVTVGQPAVPSDFFKDTKFYVIGNVDPKVGYIMQNTCWICAPFPNIPAIFWQTKNEQRQENISVPSSKDYSSLISFDQMRWCAMIYSKFFNFIHYMPWASTPTTYVKIRPYDPVHYLHEEPCMRCYHNFSTTCHFCFRCQICLLLGVPSRISTSVKCARMQ